MDTASVTAWVSVFQLLYGIGVNVAKDGEAIIKAAHPSLTPEQTAAAWDAIIGDDALRATLAGQAAGNGGAASA